MSAALTPSPRKHSGLLELADRAAAGDAEATGALLKALAPQMIRTVHALMGPTHADADDVVQQSMIALVQALPQFRGDCSRRAWRRWPRRWRWRPSSSAG